MTVKIYINTVGKVGSAMLLENYVKNNYQRYYETDDSFNEYLNTTQNAVLHGHSLEYLKRAVEVWGVHNDSNEKRFIITGWREVLSASISAFFQNISNSDWDLWYYDNPEKVRNSSPNDLIKFFNNKVAIWLDQAVLPFPLRFNETIRCPPCNPDDFFNKGIREYAANGFVALFYRLEDFDVSADRILMRTGVSRFVSAHNTADSKWYSDSYSNFRDVYVPSEDLLYKCLYSDAMSMFYSIEGIKSFYYKWQSR